MPQPNKARTDQVLYVEVWEGGDGFMFSLDWTTRDQARADREGWNLFDAGKYGWEIERDDERGEFGTDESAIAHVQMKADKGSAFHARALAIHYAHLASGLMAKTGK